MKLVIKNTSFIFIGSFDERNVPKTAGFRWDSKAKDWWTADPRIAARLMDVVEMTDNVRAAIIGGIDEKVETAELSRAVDAEIDTPCNPGMEYYGFQKAGIKFASSKNSSLIGDEMGIGKTIQAIGVINDNVDIKRVLVICPASIRLNWQIELEKWLVRPMTVGVAISNTLPIDRDVVVINYDILKRHVAALTAGKFDMLIVDECHKIKNQKTQRFIAVKAISDTITRKVFLTGTPIPNRPKEGFAVFQLIDPTTFNNYWRYAYKFCAATKGKFGVDDNGASNLNELQTILRESFMIRRLKKDVLTELPAKIRQVITLPENGLAKVIKAEEKKVREWEAAFKKAQCKVSALSANKDSDEYLKAVRALDSLIRIAFQEMSQVRRETSTAKAPYVVDHVKSLLEEIPKVVVFAHHHAVVDALMEGLADFNPVRLTGQDGINKKQAAVESFQNDDSVRVFVGSIQAAGVGITLTASSTVVFSELDWVPANMSQAEDRCHRIGQDSTVLIQHVVVDGSIDAKMAALLVEKQRVIDAALDNKLEPMDESEIISAILGATVTAEKAVAKRKADEVVTADMTNEEVADIHLVAQMLAGVCDGAYTLDGQGFNRMDTGFGKSLATQTTITKRQALALKKMCQKYVRQLPADLYERVYG
jgi:SWI/SNF-related matrix-associated actin-dependent regulator 1 of chromatin subfamily A